MLSSRKKEYPGLGKWNYFSILQVKKLRPEGIKSLARVCSVRTLLELSQVCLTGALLAADRPLGDEGWWFSSSEEKEITVWDCESVLSPHPTASLRS